MPPMNFRLPPRLELAQLPTPIALLERLSARWRGPRIWVKRDDDTGGVLSGNKVRKLAYVFREALAAGADVVVTCGGLQSNHCRATAVIARRLGLDVVLCLRGAEPPESEVPQGNYLIDRLVGAEVRFITAAEYQEHDRVMEEVARELARSGRRPFVIAEGASMPLGALGYVDACREIAESEKALGVRFDAVVHPVGSGGTSAGLELGVRLYGLEAKVWGVIVCDDESYFRPLIHRIALETIARYELPVSIEASEVGLIDGYVGGGYGECGPEAWAVIFDAGRLEGLVLDPSYTGKTLYALSRELAGPRFASAENVLFVHTGGAYGLFPKAEKIPFRRVDAFRGD